MNKVLFISIDIGTAQLEAIKRNRRVYLREIFYYMNIYSYLQ